MQLQFETMILANSLVDGFLGSNLMGQGIVLVQLLGSIVMLAVILGKWKELSYVRMATRRFVRDFTGGHDAAAASGPSTGKTILAMALGCGIGWVCDFTGSGGGILMLTVFTLVLGYNLKVAVGTSTMIMSLVALTGAVSHVSLGAQLFPLPMAIVVASCLLGAVVSAKFANRCEIRRLNRIVGVVLILLGAVTILIKLL